MPTVEVNGARLWYDEAGSGPALLLLHGGLGDSEPWAPLGIDERIWRLAHSTPDANPLPEGVEPLPAPGLPAKERLGELSVPTLVITASHDPEGFREIGPLIAGAAPNARHVELDSD